MGKMIERIQGMAGQMKAAPENKQSRAFLRVVQFFAIMLVLTIFARGAAGVTMPRVTATKTYSAEINETITATGTIAAQGYYEVELPAGLTINRIVASLGTSVKEGDTLLEFDEDALRIELTLQNAALRELRVQLQELQKGVELSTTALESAQSAADRAGNNYNKAVDELNARNRERDEAYAAWQNLVAWVEENISREDTENWEYHQGLIAGEKTKYDMAQDAVDLAQSNVNSMAELRDDANKALEKAREDHEKAKEQNAIDNEKNNIAITRKQVEIEKQEEIVALLATAQSAGGTLTAPVAGVIAEVNVAVGDVTTEKSKLRISTSDEGYVVEIPVSQTNAAKLQLGGTVYIKPVGGYGSSDATIIAKYYSAEAQSMMIRATVNGTNWTEGQSVEANVVISRSQHYSCVPISAVHSDSEGSFVYLLEERNTVLGTQMVAVRQSVTVLAQDSTNVSIESQVSLWDAQILTGSSKPVNEGDRVRIEAAVNGV